MKKSCKLNKLMLDFQNQRGFATLEIILVIMIISLLATVALPNMARMVDVAQVEYEMKILLSTLDATKSFNKNSHFKPEIFKYVNELSNIGRPLDLNVNYDKGTYQIVSNLEGVNEMHELPAGFLIEKNKSLNDLIEFDKNNNGHITITSRYGVKRYIIFDSVGHWRGSRTPP